MKSNFKVLKYFATSFLFHDPKNKAITLDEQKCTNQKTIIKFKNRLVQSGARGENRLR